MTTGPAANPFRPARICDPLAWLLLAILFAAIVYKAWALSFTIDEAFTYNEWVAAPFSDFFTKPSGGFNNHPLNTLLCHVSVALLGTSEFALRLPNVLMGLAYLASMYGLARLIFGPSPWMLLAFALTCANPLVLDHLSVARGYGLGLSFWGVGTYYLARWVSGEERTSLLVKSGAALGLAVASYLTEAFVVAGLAGAFLVLYLTDRVASGGLRGAWRFARSSATPFVIVGMAVGLPILWGPMSMKQKEQIDGDALFSQGMKSFLDTFLSYRFTVFSSYGPVWKALHRWPWGILLAFWIVLLIAIVVVAWRWRKSGHLGKLTTTDRQMLLFATAVLLTFALLQVEPAVVGHAFFGQRRLLCAVPLLLLAGPLWLYWMRSLGAAWRTASTGGAILLALLSLHLASQFTPKTFFDWEFDAGTRDIANILRSRRPERPTKLISVGSSPMLVHTVNFYRRLYGMEWMAPVSILGPECFHDYYVVMESELPALRRFDPRLLYRNETARSVLAEPGPDLRARLAALREAGFEGVPACAVDLLRPEPWTAAGKAGVNGHFLRDVMDGAETHAQRWTFARPAFLFGAPPAARLLFRLRLRLPPVVWKQTGPLRLTLWINGRRAGERRIDGPEDHQLEWPVQRDTLRHDGLTLVETELDKYFVAQDDGQKLGYLFLAGGFEPDSGQ